MNKYKLLFDILKPKIGPDPARIIIYDVYCDDIKKLPKKETYYPRIIEKLYKNYGKHRYGIICDFNFIYNNLKHPKYNPFSNYWLAYHIHSKIHDIHFNNMDNDYKERIRMEMIEELELYDRNNAIE